jgi:hypothetical protein
LSSHSHGPRTARTSPLSTGLPVRDLDPG